MYHSHSHYQYLLILTIFLTLLSLPSLCYLDIPLSITRPSSKTGSISYNFPILTSGYIQNISLSFSNQSPDYINPISSMKSIYKQKRLKKQKDQLKQKNHNNIFGLIEATSLEGYSFQGWKRYFMEAFLYIESRYYHDVIVDLNDIDKESKSQKENQLHQGKMSIGPKLKDNKIYQEIKKNTDFINYDIVSIYSGVGERNNRLQLGGYEQSYAKGDSKTGALLYQFPLKVNDNYWQLSVQKVLFTRSKNKRTDQFLLQPQPLLFKLSLQSQYIIFPSSMKSSLQSFVQSQSNQCKLLPQYLQCKNMSTIDLSLSELAFQLSPNYFINISLYDLRREYVPESKTVSFYIKLSDKVQDVQIGSVILKDYYLSIDMNMNTLMFSKTNRFTSEFSSVYIIRFFVYFFIFTVVVAIIVGIWANFTDTNRRNKVQYNNQGIQLITYQRPGGIFATNTELDD